MDEAVAVVFLLVLFALGFCLFVVGPLYVAFVMRKGEVLRIESLASPDEVMMATVGQVGTGKNWATVTQSPSNVALTYVRQPNLLILVLLAFGTCGTGLFWAGVYWWISSKKESLNVMIADSSTGNTRVQITSNGWYGKKAGHQIRDTIGVAPGATVSVVENDMPAIPGAATATPTLGTQQPAGAIGEAVPPSLSTPGSAPEQQPAPVAVAAGWYDDPDGANQFRYYDGSRWTEHRAPKQG